MFQWLSALISKVSGNTARLSPEQLMTVPIIRPEMLDQLWMYFEATGDLAAVQRIISVLDWHDLVRERLQAWLADMPVESWDYSPNREYRGLFIDCCFPILYEQRVIDGPVDLDIHVALMARSGKLKFAQLPIPLSQQEVIRLAMKSAAIWSLRSQAEKHPAVANLCREESKKPSGASRLHLADAGLKAPQS